MLQTLLDHFDLLIDAPDGVFRLREVIYDLALQGKLVAQDTGDEPASVLLERVEEEKRRLYKAKRIRKPKRLTSVAEEEKRYALPENWTWVRLGTVGEINPRNDAEDETAASFIPMTLIDDGFGTGHDAEERPWADVRKGYTHFAEGDVGLAKITPCYQNRKSAIFRNLTNGIGAGTTELHVFRSYAGAVLPEFVLLFFQSPRFIENGKALMTGTAGQQRVPRSYVEEAVLPLPPLEEQKRIVAKVDALMRLCDRLEAQQQQRQTARVRLNSAALDTLLAAENGDLPRRWQFVQDHFDFLYADSQNVARLRQAILQLAVQGELVGRSGSGKGERLGELLREPSRNGISTRPKESPPGIPILRISAGTSRSDFTVAEDDHKYLQFDPETVETYALEPGDLLACRFNGNLHYVGRVSMYVGRSETKQVYPDKLIRLRVDATRCDPAYVRYAMNASQARAQVEAMCATTAGNIGISATKLKTVNIPVPPLEEQQRIVAKVDELMRLCDALEEQLARSQEQAERLLQAVLHAAFAGQGETAEVA